MKKQCVANSSHRKGARGAVLAYTVLSVLFLFLAVGLGVDLSHLYLVKTEAQNAADASALAGATALRLPENVRLDGAADRAVDVLNQNKYNFDNKLFNAVEKVCASVTASDFQIKFAVNLDGPYYCKDDVVTQFGHVRDVRFVQVSTPRVPVSIFFAVPILGTSRTLNATATAGIATEETSPCMISLDPDDHKAFSVTSDSDLTALNCEIAVKSADCLDAYNVESSSNVTADAINVCCGDNVTSDSTSNPPADIDSQHCQVSDPLANTLTRPQTDNCTYTGEYIVNTTSHVTINPGTYCGGIKLNSDANVTFNPGMYVLNGGGLEIGSKSTVNGDGVTFFNTKTSASPYNYKPILINSDSSTTTLVNLSAPTSGAYKDLLFWQDAGAGNIDDKNLFQLNNNVNLTGNLYFPTQPLAVESNSAATITGMVIARTISVHSHSRITISTGGLGGSSSEVKIVLYK